MTKIEWSDEAWNPVTGCTPISEGCQNCYAKRMARRLKGRYGYPADEPFRVTFHPDRLERPLKWKKPRRIFACSMGDLFHEDVSFPWIDDVFSVFNLCPHHTFIVLTKRPGRMLEWYNQADILGWGSGDYNTNTWLGVTAENQERADERIPILLQIPAAVRFISFEPLLSKITGINFKGIDQIIIGCESGPKRRKCEISWIESLIRQAVFTYTSIFVKQAEIDGKFVKMPEILGREWNEYPKEKP